MSVCAYVCVCVCICASVRYSANVKLVQFCLIIKQTNVFRRVQNLPSIRRTSKEAKSMRVRARPPTRRPTGPSRSINGGGGLILNRARRWVGSTRWASGRRRIATVCRGSIYVYGLRRPIRQQRHAPRTTHSRPLILRSPPVFARRSN